MRDLSADYDYDEEGVPYVRPLWDGPVTTCRLCGNPAADDPHGDGRCWPCFGRRVYPRARGAGTKRLVGGLLLFVGAFAALMVVMAVGVAIEEAFSWPPAIAIAVAVGALYAAHKMDIF